DWTKSKASGLEKFFKEAGKIIAHPIKSFEDIFKFNGSSLKGIFSTLGKGSFNLASKAGKKWWYELWNMASGDLGGTGDATGLLGAVEKYGKGKKYVWGAAGPNSFDCSGLVMYALKHAFGIDYPHFSGSQYEKTQHESKSSAKAGDLVFWGPGKHVGVYAGNDQYYSAFSPTAHPNIGMNPLSNGVTGYSPLFGKVKGLKSSDSKSSSSSSKLDKTIKSEVGSGFFNFIKKLGAKFGLDGSESNPAGDGVERWRSDVKKALKANGFSASSSEVAAWMKVIARESGGNPKAINLTDSNAKAGHPSKGLVQTIMSTFNAYRFPGHNQIYNGFDDLLAGIHYMKAKYGSGPSAFARVSGSEGYENGGIISTNQLIEVAEHNKPEMVLPLTNKSRANQLIAQASQAVNGNNGSQVAPTDSESNEKLDKLISLMSAILGNMGSVQAVIAKSDVVNAVKSNSKTASQYSQMMGY
ncbi:NlpC/P60 family protein, partial [Gluconobacter oxydans]|uniref:NlpC/P60 family protein n=1 Tax=Gluconobacter oxydans TaxID=442 RepID=UPI00263F7DF1